MLAVDTDSLLALFREEVSDKNAPYLWSDSLAYTYMTEGVDALANEAEPFYKILTLPYTANIANLSLPASVLNIRSARDVASNRPVVQYNANNIDAVRPYDYGITSSGFSAMFTGTGLVSAYVRDYEKQALRLVPIPSIAGTLELQCTVTLSVALTTGMPLPITKAIDQRLVLHYMKWRAYSKHDAETEDLVRAKANENAFKEGVIEREVQLRQYRRSPGVARMERW